MQSIPRPSHCWRGLRFQEGGTAGLGRWICECDGCATASGFPRSGVISRGFPPAFPGLSGKQHQTIPHPGGGRNNGNPDTIMGFRTPCPMWSSLTINCINILFQFFHSIPSLSRHETFWKGARLAAWLENHDCAGFQMTEFECFS